jgi:hypothetical protein
MSCPYCASDDGCEHLLLAADVAWRIFEAGELVPAIEECNEKLSAKYLESADDNFAAEVSKRLFQSILDLAASIADAEEQFDIHDRPGLSQAYRVFYCSSPQRVSDACDTFAQHCIGHVERQPFLAR